MVKLALLLLALAVAYCLFALARPHRRCGRCKGTRRSKRYLGVAGPVGKCRKCNGRGKHKRFGATHIHRILWSVIDDRRGPREAGLLNGADLDGRRNRDRGGPVPDVPPRIGSRAPQIPEGPRP
jgi:hypothetical protein